MLPQNVGTFAAKSIGAKYATGEYLTCQDSDDWAHPQKNSRASATFNRRR
ncbi:glycosyltransferase [Psychrobacter sp. JCM 18901]